MFRHNVDTEVLSCHAIPKAIYYNYLFSNKTLCKKWTVGFDTTEIANTASVSMAIQKH